ncbi:hypothetical protein BJX64DRAFT_273280 [Aspergillus heterothallicus]
MDGWITSAVRHACCLLAAACLPRPPQERRRSFLQRNPSVAVCITPSVDQYRCRRIALEIRLQMSRRLISVEFIVWTVLSVPGDRGGDILLYGVVCIHTSLTPRDSSASPAGTRLGAALRTELELGGRMCMTATRRHSGPTNNY